MIKPVVLAQTSIYIPGFDAQAITADVEGVDAEGRTTRRIGPGVTSGTYEDPAGIIGSGKCSSKLPEETRSQEGANFCSAV